MSRLQSFNRDEQRAMRALMAAFANAGHIDLSAPEDEVWDQFIRAMENVPDDFDVVPDHTPKLLRQARKAYAEENYELAVLMYATWIEHSINLVLQQLAIARGISSGHFNAMLREASLRAKTTWLLPLLGAKSLSTPTTTFRR